jgi:hypothetical protein
VTPFIAAGTGFLSCVLWFDLMFDVQVARGSSADALDSIERYYRRVTTTAQPMGSLIALVMVATLAALVVQLVQDQVPDWASGASLVLVTLAVVRAGTGTVPNAVRLGAGEGDAETLAKSVLRDHVLCFTAVVSTLVLQLAFCL